MERLIVTAMVARRILHNYITIEPTAGGPAALDPEFAWLYDGDEVVQNSVGDLFVENAFISKTLQVHFKTLELHANFVGNVDQHDRAVIRLPGLGAYRRELGAVVLDREITLRGRVFENFEDVAETAHGDSITNQMGQSFWSNRVLLYRSLRKP